MPGFRSSLKREAVLRTAHAAWAQAWEDRKTLVKQELAAEAAANDAKTARLRALRLAMEARDSRAAHLNPPIPPSSQPKKRAKGRVGSP
jgi:hypothetical protein